MNERIMGINIVSEENFNSPKRDVLEHNILKRFSFLEGAN